MVRDGARAPPHHEDRHIALKPLHGDELAACGADAGNGVAGVLEIVWAFALKQSAGFSKPVEAVIAVVAMIASFVVLSMAMKSLPLGVAYTVWTGIGAAGTAVLGIAMLGDSAAPLRILCIILILAGVIGLKLFSEN